MSVGHKEGPGYAVNYSVRNVSRGRPKMKQLVPARSRPSLMDHPIFSPRPGWAEPSARAPRRRLPLSLSKILETDPAKVRCI